MIEWIRKAKPPIVVIENVFSAPWDEKVRLFQREGYDAAYGKFDTKKYYIPHTRQRGYLVAVRKGNKILDFETSWKSLVKSLEHPVTPCLDAFMFSNDDPRVIRGKARLLAESLSGGKEGKTGRTDWTKVRSTLVPSRTTKDRRLTLAPPSSPVRNSAPHCEEQRRARGGQAVDELVRIRKHRHAEFRVQRMDGQASESHS
jgi:site-specific DNA-cytosine methylase